MEAKTRIDLPGHVTRPFEVFVNGIPQTEGTDFEAVGSSLVFAEKLSREGNIGFWRWLRMGLGIAGTYRKNDTIDVVFSLNGRRVVATLAAPVADGSVSSGAS
ncbi:MAG TPA: hypothetical protein VH063_03715 [Gaiellaceae bacterium]|jgi:hypothetical protein|nr:hypothetical protein [Gaiellaceae bacterium]